MKKLFCVLALLFASNLAQANETAVPVPIKVKGVSGPTLAANGFPLTYNLWIQSEVPLTELIKKIHMEGKYVSDVGVLVNHGAFFIFPYSEREGLLQLLFIVPEMQTKGIYKFEGQLTFFPNGKSQPESVTMNLPTDTLEVGGPHAW